MDRLGVVKVKPIVTSALACDDPDTVHVQILIGHQWVSIPKMENILLYTMQIWVYDVIVNNQPMFLTDNPAEEGHAINPPRK